MNRSIASKKKKKGERKEKKASSKVDYWQCYSSRVPSR